jgi:hypothetical protein
VEWVLDHLQFVIAIVVIVAYVLNNMRRRAGGREDVGRDETGGGAPPPVIDAEENERTRRIQEEIRRRILARQRGESGSVQPPPLPVEEEREIEEPEWLEEGPRPQAGRPPPMPMAFPSAPREPVAEAARSMDAATVEILEQQRLLAQQLEALRAARALGSAAVPPLPAAAYTAAGSAAAAAAAAGLRRAVRADLAGRGGLRRAIILREILGEAPGLKRGPLQLPRR